MKNEVKAINVKAEPPAKKAFGRGRDPLYIQIADTAAAGGYTDWTAVLVAPTSRVATIKAALKDAGVDDAEVQTRKGALVGVQEIEASDDDVVHFIRTGARGLTAPVEDTPAPIFGDEGDADGGWK